MRDEAATNPDRWSIARFPSSGVRENFLGVLYLRNRLEDLPSVEAEPLRDGYGLRYRTVEHQRQGIDRLIGSYGGTVLG